MATITLKKLDGYVKVVVYHGDRRWKITTGIKVDDHYWNKDRVKKSHPNYDSVNNSITAVFNQVLQASINVRNRGELPTVHAIRAERSGR